MANWHPDGFIGGAFRTIASHVPPPRGVRSPLQWGDVDRVRELLGYGVRSLELAARELVWRFASPEHMLDYFRRWYGPTNAAFAALDDDVQTELARDLLCVCREHNRAGEAAMAAPSAYVEVTAVRA
jgi:hypothetical protein